MFWDSLFFMLTGFIFQHKPGAIRVDYLSLCISGRFLCGKRPIKGKKWALGEYGELARKGANGIIIITADDTA